ncbi:MAG: iron-sulfur cluster assembly scaffold protein [Desulfovibrio sp.]|nr:MAG: iron-sulfur cluster assembly scaffold protein [Desulfovibrio sp.]
MAAAEGISRDMGLPRDSASLQPPENVGERFIAYLRSTKYVGELEQPGGVSNMTGKCGDVIGAQVQVRGEKLAVVRMQPRGCAYTFACAEAAAALVDGRTLDQALEVEPEDVAEELGGLPEDHLHCARLALNAVGEAITDYLRRENSTAKGGGNAHL